MATHPQPTSSLDVPSSLRVISLNCWGLKYISANRRERLLEIGRQLASATPTPHIVGLQECWTQEDFRAIHAATQHILPYAKFYHAGFFGAGLAILSRWPIVESSMYAYPLNGRPAAFYRGDWFVGKGVASARIRIGSGARDVVEVFCTHLHAPYEPEHRDSYACHRTAQAWEIAKLMRHAAERGHLVLGLGDFNMLPLSLAHRLIEAHSPVKDVWRILKPDSALGSSENAAEKARGGPVPSVEACLSEHGATCDSMLNTWRWSKQMQKDLKSGKDREVDLREPDPKAKRLDYIFFAGNENTSGTRWEASGVQVGMTTRHPELRVSLSDHFSVEATITKVTPGQSTTSSTASSTIKTIPTQPTPLPQATYREILAMVETYALRERTQRTWRMRHFAAECLVAIACLVAVWWSPRNFVAFILMLLSTLGLSAGVLDGLMGGLFVRGELRALKEFEWEVRNALVLAYPDARV